MSAVYISGPMTGYPGHNFAAFNAAEGALRLRGYTALNPATRGVIDGWTWSDYLKSDILMLLQADIVVTLPNWQESRGACLEVHIAQSLGLRVLPLAALLKVEGPPTL